MAGASITQSIQPTQRAGIFYNASAVVGTDFRNKTSLVILGRTPTNSGAAEAAAAGAIVGVYLDATMRNTFGTYNSYFYTDTTGGNIAIPAFSRGGTADNGPPANLIANQSGVLAKYEATVRKIKAEMPFVNAIFCDDQGPNWSGYFTSSTGTTWNLQSPCTAADREDFYNAQVALGQRARTVADELGLLLVCNGEWRADTNFGYPVRNQWGCSFYDAFCIEHHTPDQVPFWTTVGNGQWRLRDPQGQRCMFFIANDSSQVTGFRNQQNIAWMTQQTASQYTAASVAALTQLTPHDLGLSFGAAPPTITVTVSPTSATLLTGTTQAFTATASNGGTLTWKVNGTTGGSAALGTISPTTGTSVTYTAPATVPSGGVVTISASLATGQLANAAVTITTSAPPPADPQLPAAPAPAPRAFGNRFSALIPNNMTPNYVRGCLVTAPEDGTAVSISFGCDGAAGGTADQPVTASAYDTDASGNGSTLVRSALEHTILTGDPAAWITKTLTSTFDFSAGDTFYLALESDGTEATGRFFRNVNTGVSRGMSDTYADGMAATLAGAAVGDADISIYINYTPAAVAGTSIQVPHRATSVHTLALSGGALTVDVQYVAIATRYVSVIAPEGYPIDSRDGTELVETSPGVFQPK